MYLKVIHESNGVVQFDGDEPNANRDYFAGFNINTPEKHAEHVDGLTGIDRAEKSAKLARDLRKKHKRPRRKKSFGEVINASDIAVGGVSSVDILIPKSDPDNDPSNVFNRNNHIVGWDDTLKGN